MSKLPTVEEMLKSGMHFGHRTSRWHPKMKPFIFTSKNGVHIIDLMKSQKMLGTAIDFMKKLSSENKVVLFVGTKTQVREPMKAMCEAIGMPYIVGKWMGGCMTNFSVIKKMIKNYRDLLEQKQSGKLAKYTKKERLELDREMERLEFKVGGLVNLNKLPDAIFVWDIKQESTAVAEAKKKNIPLIGICDTNVNPTDINYVIPSNDDATKTIKLVLNSIKESLLENKTEAGKAAK